MDRDEPASSGNSSEDDEIVVDTRPVRNGPFLRPRRYRNRASMYPLNRHPVEEEDDEQSRTPSPEREESDEESPTPSPVEELRPESASRSPSPVRRSPSPRRRSASPVRHRPAARAQPAAPPAAPPVAPPAAPPAAPPVAPPASPPVARPAPPPVAPVPLEGHPAPPRPPAQPEANRVVPVHAPAHRLVQAPPPAADLNQWVYPHFPNRFGPPVILQPQIFHPYPLRQADRQGPAPYDAEADRRRIQEQAQNRPAVRGGPAPFPFHPFPQEPRYRQVPYEEAHRDMHTPEYDHAADNLRRPGEPDHNGIQVLNWMNHALFGQHDPRPALPAAPRPAQPAVEARPPQAPRQQAPPQQVRPPQARPQQAPAAPERRREVVRPQPVINAAPARRPSPPRRNRSPSPRDESPEFDERRGRSPVRRSRSRSPRERREASPTQHCAGCRCRHRVLRRRRDAQVAEARNRYDQQVRRIEREYDQELWRMHRDEEHRRAEERIHAHNQRRNNAQNRQREEYLAPIEEDA